MGGDRVQSDDLGASIQHGNRYTKFLGLPGTLNVLDWDSAIFCFSTRIQRASEHLADVSLRILIRILLQLLIV